MDIDNLTYSRSISEQKDSLYYVSDAIDDGSKVLDLGCWEGALGQYLIDQKQCIVDGVELDPVAASKARKHYRNLYEADLENFDFQGVDKEYDYVVCADVLEHLKDPDKLLSLLKPLLAKGGKLIVSVPNVGYGGVIAEILSGRFDYRPSGILDSTHLRFFTRQTAIELVERFGYNVSTLRVVNYHLNASEFSDYLTGEDSNGLRTILAHIPDSGSYQFVMVCSTDPNADSIPDHDDAMANAMNFPVQVYWAEIGCNYDEDSSVTCFADMRERQSLIFKIPRLNKGLRLRVDLCNFVGFLELDELMVLDDRGRQLVDVFNPKSVFCVTGGSMRKKLRGAKEIYEFNSSDTDPHLEFLVGEDTVFSESKYLVVKVRLGYLGSAAEMAVLHNFEAELDRHKAELGQAQAQIIRQVGMFNAITTSSSWKITMPLRALSRLGRGDWSAIKAGIKKHFPLVTSLFDPAYGGFNSRLSHAFGVLIKQGPSAFYRKIKSLKKNNLQRENPSIYLEWLEKYTVRNESESSEILERLPEMDRPLISIVMPTYNTDEPFLRKCIESVLYQSYQNWELCIADDASTDPHVKTILTQYQKEDKRIKTVFRDENGHISAASNSALALVTGDWVALLDHDDELHRHSLITIVNTLNQVPDAEFLYSDEDKIDSQGNHLCPHFKPDWNLDLLYSQNYVSHLSVYKTDILKAVGGFRLGYEGSQDYDLLLRYSREIDHSKIVHIPKVLYHWRITDGSTAFSPGEKPYTTEAGIRALNDHFEALNENVTVEKGPHSNVYKVSWEIKNEPLVSLIIPTFNGYKITKQAIESILNKSTYRNFEILLVDNNSNDPEALEYFKLLAIHEKVTVLRYPHEFNYSAINNFAAKHANGEILGLVNNDIEVITPEWLAEMVSHAQRADIGCVGAMLYYDNDTIQHAGVICGVGGVAGHSHKHFPRGDLGYFSRLKLVQNLSAVTAACLLVRKSVFDEVGGLNEEDLSVAFNDVDFCLRVKAAGYRNLWTPYAELYHYESISRGYEDSEEKKARFSNEVLYMKRTWGDSLENDHAYSPNLTIESEDFSFTWPPRNTLKRSKKDQLGV